MSRTGPDRGVLSAPLPEVASWGTDAYADALRNGHGPLFLRRTDGWLLPLDVERWCAVADAADLSALSRCEGPVLDIGCGPGRLVAALAARGHRALGIDVSEAAVTRTLRLGGSALHRSVFEPLPGEGRWGTVLLVDGNVGIGGDPRRLLHRTTELLAPGGLLVAETAPQDIDERVLVQLDDGRAMRLRTGRGRPVPVGPARHTRTVGIRPPPRAAPRRSVGRGRPLLRLAAARPERPEHQPEPGTQEQHGRDQQPVPQEHIGGQPAVRLVVLGLPGDQREPHEQQQSGEEGRNPDVVHRAGTPTGTPAQQLVRRRVERNQHQVVHQGRAHEPHHDAERVPRQQPYPRVSREGEGGGHQDEVQYPLAVPTPHKSTGVRSVHSSPKVEVSPPIWC